MSWKPRTAADYAHALAALLPTGEVWPRDPSSTLMRLVAALADVSARWADRAARFLLIEAFPPSAVDTLPDWERVLGLPEPGMPVATTDDERRLYVLERLQRRPGAQSRAYYLEIARRLGYHDPARSPFQLPFELPGALGNRRRVEIVEHRPFMAGVSRCGDPAWEVGPPELRFMWRVIVPGGRATWFRCGEASAGADPHAAFARAEDLELVLRRLKPAHTVLFFDYQGA